MKHLYRSLSYLAAVVVFCILMYGLLIPALFNAKNDVTPILAVVLGIVSIGAIFFGLRKMWKHFKKTIQYKVLKDFFE